jgi:hypothetical protein
METSGTTPRVAVRAAELAELAGGRGPFATVVLATEADVDNAAQRTEVRWKTARDELAQAGAPEELLTALDPVLPEAHLEGDGLALVARADGTLHVEHLATPPRTELVRWATLPSLVPVLEWRQGSPPHVVVVADREGADIVAVRRDGPDVRHEAGGEDAAISKVRAGGWSNRRYQDRAENTWERNADDAAAKIATLAQRVGARLVIVAGDVRAVALLRDALPQEVAELVREADGGRSPDGSAPVLAAHAARLLDEAVADDTRAVLAKFAEERGQGDRAADGADETLEALAAAQVDVLLVAADDPDDDRTAWFGPGPVHVSATGTGLRDLGVDEPVRGRLVDVAVRAALGTRAGVRVVPSDAGVTDGIGAILRW